MHIEYGHNLDFKDVFIRPKRSSLRSRAEIEVTRRFFFRHSRVQWNGFPLIASNMDATGTFEMARALEPLGVMVALHKYYPADQLIEFFRRVEPQNVFYTGGTNSDDMEKLSSVKAKVAVPKISIDVANGYRESFLDVVARVRDQNPKAVLMAGTIATAEMAEALLSVGADIVRVGIGSGSACTTRDVTGVGYPQLSAVIECADAAHRLKGHICSDGGCTSSGDVAKAFAGGADFVMLGGMLAGHQECDGEWIYEDCDGQKVPVAMKFCGMASETALRKYHGGVAHYRAAEGATLEVPYRGAAKDTIRAIAGGLRSMMTYIGASQLSEVESKATFIVIK